MYISDIVVTSLVQVVYGILVSVFGRYAWWVLFLNAGLFKIFHKGRGLRKCPDILCLFSLAGLGIGT